MALEKIINIPESDLDKIRKDFESEGAEVETIRQPNGNYTITARFSKSTSGVDKVHLIADTLANMRPEQLLALLVVGSVIGAVGLALRALWFALIIDIAVGTGSMLLLIRKHLNRLQRFFMIILILLAVATAGLFGWRLSAPYRLQFNASDFRKELQHSGLPPDLYDRQNQLESLTIQQRDLKNVGWLNSTVLTDLTIASQSLRSLEGLTQVPQLQSLEVDLGEAPIESLNGIASLHRLRTLVLRNIGRAKMKLIPPLGSLPGLKTLDLDFERSNILSLPDFTACQELQDLRLNLRATAGIVELPDLSALHQLRYLTLFLDNSTIRNLKPLAKLDHLQTLTIVLDGTQLELLRGWLSELKDRLGPRSLSLFFTTPPNTNLPDLSGIQGLISLNLRTPGNEFPASAVHLHKLQELTLSAQGSEITKLPDVGQLTSLQILNLDLQASKVSKLPDISRLHDLQKLTLNLGNTEVPELPNFAQMSMQFPKLRELNLSLAYTQIHSLHGIEHLSELQTLSLDIRGTKIEDIGSIARISSLEKLGLRLQWSQVGNLPDLSMLKKLNTVEFHMDDWWNVEELPDLSHLPDLRKISLALVNSDAKNLAFLEKISGLEELYLDLRGTSIENLPDLMALASLHIVDLDIRHSRIQIAQTQALRSLNGLTIDKSFSSLEGLPQSVRKLVIGS